MFFEIIDAFCKFRLNVTNFKLGEMYNRDTLCCSRGDRTLQEIFSSYF